MLRPSQLNPQLSAYTLLHGHHNFMSQPLAPAGYQVVIHDRPMDRGSWANRGTDGFFISQAPNHYRNFKCYTPSTNSTRISNTVKFFPAHDKPKLTAPGNAMALILDQLKEALLDC